MFNITIKFILLIICILAINTSLRSQHLWQKSFHANSSGASTNPKNILPISNSELLCYGIEQTGQNRSYLFIIDTAGTIGWIKYITDFSIGSVLSIGNNELLLAGTANSGWTNLGIGLIKMDLSGNIVKSRVFNGNGIEFGGVLAKNSHNQIYCGGGTNDFFLFRTDTALNFYWGSSYGGGTADDFFGLKTSADGCALLLGEPESNNWNYYNQNMALVKIDSSGSVVFSLDYGTNYGEFATDVLPLKSDYYLLGFGSITNTVQGTHLLKLDSSGSIKWSKSFFKDKGVVCTSFQLLSDSTFLMAGHYRALNGDFRMLAAKADTSGNVIWAKTYGPSFNTIPGLFYNMSFFHNFAELNNRLYFVGQFLLPNSVVRGYILKTDLNGNTDCLYLPLSLDSVSSTFITSPFDTTQSYGSIFSYNPVTANFNIIDSTICPMLGIPAETIHEQISLFPNPFNHSLTFTVKILDEYEISIFDVAGKLIIENSFTGKEIELQTSTLSDGLYYYVLQNSRGEKVRGKVIKQ